jgi:hypothetical protein
MQMYERQFFDALLREAAGNFAQRCVHRAGGPESALQALRDDPQALGLKAFVDAFFAENLLEEPGGSCFVLQGLQTRTLPPDPGGPVAEVLARQARAAFSEVLTVQTSQVIQQQQIYF